MNKFTTTGVLLQVTTLLSLLLSSSAAFGVLSGSYRSTALQRYPLSTRGGAATNDINTMTTEVQVGGSIPSVTLNELVTGQERPVPVNIAELIAGKKVAIFGVPGAFTPGCSKSHLPSFMEAQTQLQEKGIDMTICIATNDAYVMEAWGRTSGGSEKGIRFLADDSGALTKALGLVMEAGNGIRTKRFSLIAENGKVTHYFSSAKQSSDTWAPAVLSAL